MIIKIDPGGHIDPRWIDKKDGQANLLFSVQLLHYGSIDSTLVEFDQV